MAFGTFGFVDPHLLNIVELATLQSLLSQAYSRGSRTGRNRHRSVHQIVQMSCTLAWNATRIYPAYQVPLNFDGGKCNQFGLAKTMLNA